ncbi:MAG: c-type cytochrome biogenesis protein CcmI [Caulobacter sp.]|nr:c-type cytochrome biogenesis protein CcmI [Caulobacter sp.]
MILFWMVAAALSAAAAGLVLAAARRAERRAVVAEDPALAVHRRQLEEIEDLVARDLLDEREYADTRAEAGRRLLAAADQVQAEPLPGGRWLVPAAAGLVPICALAIYFLVGSPGVADQPMSARIAQWSRINPEQLTTGQAALMLEQQRKKHPNDPQLLRALAYARMQSGDAYGAAKALREAVVLSPNDAELWEWLGVAFMATNNGEVGADARRALDQALKIDPKAASPRYLLARADIAEGRTAEGLAGWRALLQDLPPGDEHRPGLAAEIAQVERTGRLPGAQPVPQAGAAGGPNIQAMVDGLAARLEANPDDPDGWARLIRAYAVLGDAEKQAAALEKARQQFKSRPDILRRLESASEAPQ